MDVFGLEGRETRKKYTRFYRFKAFQAAFPAKDLVLPSASMLNINKIDYRTKGNTESHTFTPSMFSESSIVGNISVFQDLNVNQIGIQKTNPR